MKRFICVSALLVLIASTALLQRRAVAQAPAAGAAAAGAVDQHREMLSTYCFDCHNGTVKAGGLALDALSLNAATGNAQIWEKVLRKLRGRLMPPPGNQQPPQKDIDAFTSWMEAALDAKPGPVTAGYVPVERLNRTEYAASVKDLLAVDVDEKDILPQDVQVEGFDNIASVLTTSPAFLDQYIDAARRIAKKAVGDMAPPTADWPITSGGNQDPELPFPPGLRQRDAMAFTQDIPADGEYRFSFSFDEQSIGLYNRELQNRTTLVMMIDGGVKFKGDIGGSEDLRLANVENNVGWQKILDRFAKIPVKLEAGPHTIIVGFIDRSHVESDDNVGGGGGGFGGGGGAPMARLADSKNVTLEIKGPYNPTGISNSPSRPLIFVCDPKAAGETACARQIAENLAHRAYRRPVTADDVSRLMRFYDEGRLDNGTFDRGVTELVAAVLASPDFLFRSIPAPKGVSKNSEFPLTDLELASRLSFFIWNAGPDAELLKLAESKQLTKPGVLDAQVKRMMADPKAESLVSSFAMKWLNLNSLDLVQPDPRIFNNFNATLRKDFTTEAEKFLGGILLDNRNVTELLTSNQTFVNDTLARYYGIQGPTTSAFKQVTLTDPNRFGLLGKAAVLMRTSYADRTSPVLRGAWVLDKIVGTPPTPPPPNVVTNLTQEPGEAPKTVRARLEAHRNSVACKQCHGVIDPTGLALENFDAIGQYRTTDREAGNAKIDASTVMPNGAAIDGPVQLREELAKDPEKFVTAMTEKLMMYAVNRQLEYFDMPQVRKAVRDAKKDNYTLASLVLGVVNTDAFLKQGPEVVSQANPQGAAPQTSKAVPQPNTVITPAVSPVGGR
jgi:mono/diheme cytochrome c family protein